MLVNLPHDVDDEHPVIQVLVIQADQYAESRNIHLGSSRPGKVSSTIAITTSLTQFHDANDVTNFLAAFGTID